MTAFTITFILTPSPAHKFHILELTAGGWGEGEGKEKTIELHETWKHPRH